MGGEVGGWSSVRVEEWEPLTTQVSSELSRVSSELSRVSSELSRVSSELTRVSIEREIMPETLLSECNFSTILNKKLF
jgi:hypothetical protein